MEYLKYNSGTGMDQNWLIEESVFAAEYVGKCESIFCQGNGYLCQRSALEERYVGETRGLFVTGTFDLFSPEEVTELPNLPDMTALKLWLGGERFSMETGTLHRYRRVLNLRNGLVTRTAEWESPKGYRYELCFERFVSMDNEHLLGSRMRVTPLGQDASITVESGIDGRVSNTGSQHFLEGEKRLYDGRYLENCSTTGQSGVRCCQHMVHKAYIGEAEQPEAPFPIIDRRYLGAQWKRELKAGESFTLEKICAVHTGRDLAYDGEAGAGGEAVADGLALIRKAETEGYETLFEKSAAAWEKLWQRMDVKVDSEEDYHQLALRFALYHMNIMIKKDDNRVGIGAKGMSGEGYKGHSFWDTEIFILPYFSLTQPEAARTLLEYRWRGLYGARKKAEENGYTGAMYPWESAWIDDGEVTPLWGAADVVTGKPMKILTGILEHHITADIAFAVWQYFTVTGDRDFMNRCGYEIILETARFWASRCTYEKAKDRYEIGDVIGPDEYKEHVDNNAYTNYMAAHNMKLALQVLGTLESEGSEVYTHLKEQLDFEGIRKAVEPVLHKLYLPKPDDEGILPQFDGYFDMEHIDLTPYKESDVVGTIYNDYNIEQISGFQVSKQADLLILFLLLEELFSEDVKRKNYKFYEERTLHDSSLSKNTHCVLACDLGLQKEAEEFFEGSCNVDLGPVMTTSDMGIHSAAMGGIWQSAVYGFGGVRVVGDALHIRPRLHSQWKKLSFPLVWRGNPLSVTIKPDEVCVENRGDKPVKVTIGGEEMLVATGDTVKKLCDYKD